MTKIFTKISLLFIGLMLCAGNAWATATAIYLKSDPLSNSTPTGVSYEWVEETTQGWFGPETNVVALEFSGTGSIPNQANTTEYTGSGWVTNFMLYNSWNSVDITRIIFGDGIGAIGTGHFEVSDKGGANSWRYVTTIYCNATTPPTIAASGVFPSEFEEIPLYVPAESLEAYQASNWNSYFNTIIAEEEPVAPIAVGSTFTVSGVNYEVTALEEGSCNCPEGSMSYTLGEQLYCIDMATYANVDPIVTPGIHTVKVVENKTVDNSGWFPTTTYNYTGNITIPATVEYDDVTWDVTEIGAQAFAMSTGLTGVTLSNGLETIGDYAFAYCSGLATISIPNTVTSIGTGAFGGCTSLASLTIPTSVTSIGANAFYGVSNASMASGTATLVDNNDAVSIMTFLMNDTRDLAINRPAQLSNQYNTLCLPFSMNETQIAASTLADAEIYKFSNAEKDGDNLDLHFQPVTTIEAGVPYFIRYPQDGDNLTGFDFDDVTVSTTTAGSVTHGDVTLHGTLSTVSVSGNDKLYLAAGNELHWSSSTKNIPPFRAYFSVAGLGAGAPPRARIVERENTATDIESVQSSVISSEKIIENGQLFIIKNGVKYNAQGQIVK